jgi:hypothetical protein
MAHAAGGLGSRQAKLYEVIGSHFVDIYFNFIYSTATKEVKSGKALSITMAYQNSVTAYVSEVQSKQQPYKKTVELLRRYVEEHLMHGISDYATFVDRIVVTLIPEQYFESLTAKDKDEVFANMVCNLIAGLGKYSTLPENLVKTIDQRSNRQTAQQSIEEMQNYAVTLLFHEQARLSNRFLGVATNAKDAGPVDHVLKLRKLALALAADKGTLGEQVKALASELEAMTLKYKRAKLKNRSLLSRLNQTGAAPMSYAPPMMPVVVPSQPPGLPAFAAAPAVAASDPLALSEWSQAGAAATSTSRDAVEEVEDDSSDDGSFKGV